MRFVALVVALVAVSSPAAGQESPPLARGARVRVTVANAESRSGAGVFVGVYQGSTDAALWLQPGAAAQSIPLGQLRRLEVSRGRKPSWLRGTVGFLIGGTVGFFAVGCLDNSDSSGVPCLGHDHWKFVLGGAVGGLAGAAIGAFVFRREQWDVVDVWPR